MGRSGEKYKRGERRYLGAETNESHDIGMIQKLGCPKVHLSIKRLPVCFCGIVLEHFGSDMALGSA